MIGHTNVQTRRWNKKFCSDSRALVSEVPVAITVNGSTYAVMLTTPCDLEDFAYGFAFTEGLIEASDHIEECSIIELSQGYEARLWLHASKADGVLRERRRMAGPSGCGLCGVESLERANKVLPRVSGEDICVSAAEISGAMIAVQSAQPMNALTRAAHAAAIWTKPQGLVAVREDVGRHNALDKLVGTCLRRKEDTSSSVILMTSRVSVELVQKVAVLGAPVLCAISAPTSLAVESADMAGITLIGVARDDGFEVFTHSYRVGS